MEENREAAMLQLFDDDFKQLEGGLLHFILNKDSLKVVKEDDNQITIRINIGKDLIYGLVNSARFILRTHEAEEILSKD